MLFRREMDQCDVISCISHAGHQGLNQINTILGLLARLRNIDPYLSSCQANIRGKSLCDKLIPTNIPVLQEIFSRHGYPNILVIDIGPPWNGTVCHIMQRYLKWAGCKDQPTRSAEDPEANYILASG